jgi:hypothetical protein
LDIAVVYGEVVRCVWDLWCCCSWSRWRTKRVGIGRFVLDGGFLLQGFCAIIISILCEKLAHCGLVFVFVTMRKVDVE